MTQKHIVPQHYEISRRDRNHLNGHRSFVVWFTGLSGSGKSTLANLVEKYLLESEVHTYLLDGDNVRHGLCSDLDFSSEGRTENIRRIGEVANLMVDAGLVVLTAFVSPFREDRERVRRTVGSENYVEVFVDCPVEECEKRDVKGLYKKAREGVIKDFTGISSPFEPPVSPDVHVHTDKEPIEESLKKIKAVIAQKLEIVA
ncbi:MAG: adenylyl-sulfate kinase [Bacteroidota bacterium]|nr:adenylyl-sulfate kinase [Bacteroidota bacterium]MDX5405194.1 adenylyl-sulfate kinase [Bacteroidota bacterium]MDX5428317.1 adenylyl-sulfate kinase [Bacteroidota bacterium]MDX5506094.1 adenylyl-sulfate kinase [Bacteroidota bacterium]